MNLKNYCLGIIKSAIPMEMLQLGFFNREMNDHMMSLDYKISSRALDTRFFLDLNLISGVEVIIPLEKCIIVSVTDSATLIRIPDSVLNGRRLINVLNILTSMDYRDTFDKSISGIAAKSFNQDMGMNSLATTRLEKISDNEFMVYSRFDYLPETGIKVLLTYSESFNEVSAAFYPSLSLTALEAVKLYIYNTLVVRSSQTHLYNGYELQVISEIIDTYSDSFERYMELMNGKTKKQMFMSDRPRMRSYMQMALGNNS